MIALTHSSMLTMKRCLRQFYYKYELLLSRERTADALRIGTIVHVATEMRAKVKTIDAVEEFVAIETIQQWVADSYAIAPEWADETEWQTERATVQALLAGYFWLYGEDNIKYIEPEQQFEIPLTNPETNCASRTYVLRGKSDAIVKLNDRVYVLERKTTSDDISANSDYWLKLRIDPQISIYYMAAQEMGYDPCGVIYDVIRKPSIRPRQIPAVDGEGFKIVRDATGTRVMLDNGKPRQAGDTAKGWTLESRTETPDEFGERLLQDIQDRPDFYFARREIPRLEDDLTELKHEIWQQAKLLTSCRNSGYWFKNVGFACDHCEFSGICLNSQKILGDTVPAGFIRRTKLHPELDDLEGSTYDNHNNATPATGECAASNADECAAAQAN